MKLSFQYKLFISLVAFFSVLFIALGIYYYFDASRQLYQEMSARAKIQAEEIALMPNLRQQVSRHDPQAIQAFMQQIAAHSDASFIVIGDRQGVHLFHSVHPEWVGTRLVGGDNQAVLEGKSITTIRKGGLGVSLRSKTPIVDDAGQVIGIVSVGYLTSYIANINARLLWRTGLYGIALLLLLFMFSWVLARTLKKQMFGLEPKDIAQLVLQQKALLEAMYEGVFAVNADRQLILINRAAREMLNLRQSEQALLGKPLDEVIQLPPAFFAPGNTAYDSRHHDHITVLNHRETIVNRVAIEVEPGTQSGWVFSFRDKNDITTLSSQLSQVTRYADNLRMMRHEQLNWTATLVGLLQMQRYDDALRYIRVQSEGAQQALDFLSTQFTSPALCGLLLGKYVGAREKGITLTFDPACQLSRLPQGMSETEWLSVIGNLVDNAIDATLHTPARNTPVEVYISDRNHELVIEVADQGGGVDEAMKPHIFEQGFTSKPADGSELTGSEHGIGLYLVAGYVRRAGGSIEISDNSPQGTVFSVFIPFQPPLAAGLSHD